MFLAVWHVGVLRVQPAHLLFSFEPADSVLILLNEVAILASLSCDTDACSFFFVSERSEERSYPHQFRWDGMLDL